MPSLHFKGKQLIQNHHLVVPFHELKPVKAKSVLAKGANVSLHDNVIMHGDNLAALKALLPTHHGKIKCIYIDPPYNTGKEDWAYNDNVNDPMLIEWVGKVVDKDDLTRHDKWLCMMWPRLRLLRELLSEKGIIFISIDENEVHHLKMIMNEMFGEDNFIADLVWHSTGHTDNQYDIKIMHEHVLVYAKRADLAKLGYVVDPNTREESNLWKGYAENSITKNGQGNPPSKVVLPVGFPCTSDKISLEKSDLLKAFFNEVDALGYITRDITAKYEASYPVRLDEMVVKNKKLVKECTVFSGWANVNKLKEFIANKCRPISDEDGDTVEFYLSGNGVIYYKKTRSKARNIVSVLQNFSTTEKMRSSLEAIGIKFSYPKPLELITYLLKVGFVSNEDVVLDSFAGSGTTAHAVLALNKEDGGNRKFILIETLDYADTITAERVRRVINGVPNAKDEALKKGLGGTFSYFELGKPVEIQTILNGKNLPPFNELARYVFFMATGEEWNEKELDKKKNYIGESRNYHVYLFYDTDIEYLKNTALTLEHAKALPKWKQGEKRRLIFAPTKYLDQDYLDRFGIDFARLPYEIYQLAGDKQKAKG